jgi:diguanylate cyclase (GGDEF)-like protein
MSSEQPRILVCDDDPNAREILLDLCETSGFKAVLVDEGADAVERARETRPDVILLDLLMPRVSGFQVLRQLKSIAELADTPVIVLSAASDVDGKIRALEMGAEDYVTKPVKLFELATRIKVAASLRRYRNKLRSVEAELAELKGQDPRSGVGGPHQLFQTLRYELSRARRFGRPLAAVGLAPEGLDRIESTLGVVKAEEALFEAISTIRARIRNVDRIFRDGDAIVLLLPETDSTGAAILAERLATAVAQKPLPTGNPQAQRVLLRVGMAIFPSDRVGAGENLVRVALESIAPTAANG